MSAQDTARSVLAKASLFDPTFGTPDVGVVIAWSEALGDLEAGDALVVVTAHYSEQTRRIMPADVIAGVRKIRAKRIKADFREPPYDKDDVLGGLRRIRAHRKAIADGLVPEPESVGDAKRPVETMLRRALAGEATSPDESA